MVGVRAFTPLCNSSMLFTSAQQKPICFQPTPSPSSYSWNRFHLSLSNHNCVKERNGFRAFAVKKRRKDKGGVLARESFDEFEDDDDEDDEEEGLLMPMEKMRQWLENRPAGFGEGKVYDTTVEDKLLDEMQQSRVAQLANINKLKHNPIPPKGSGVGKTPPKGDFAASEVVTPTGVRVRLLNLPKKKNIHRDLQLAFKEVPGIISISPAVTGSKKTRDPICKGHGFVYFKSEEHANRFVEIFATMSIAFGKIQKQIKCELASPSDATLDTPMTSTLSKSSLPVLSYHEDDTFITKMNQIAPEALEESDSDTEIVAEELEQIPESPQPASNHIKLKSASEVTAEEFELFLESSKPASEDIKVKSASVLQETKPPAKKKAVVVKVKGPNPAKLGSANKLKSKDKNLLTGVFSKYAANAKSTSSKDS